MSIIYLRPVKGRERKTMQLSLKEIKLESVREICLQNTHKSDPYFKEPLNDYHQIDALSQLKANVEKINDLHFRLNYLMSEIQSLVKKR